MSSKIIRRHLTDTALDRLRKRPVVAILGARQVGKTTLSQELMAELGVPYIHLDLEDPDHRSMLNNAKEYLLTHSHELVVIDEVQRMPELFPLLRTLVDRDRRSGRFLLLGSSSPVIVQRASESLAGRIAYLDLFPFSIHEVGFGSMDRLWLNGGFPEAFHATISDDANAILQDLIRSFTERDLPSLGLQANPNNTRQLLSMLATVHGSVLNMALLGKSIGLSGPTIKLYLRFFEEAFMCFTLPSYHVNLRKRLTRSPKLYITDSGVLHTLLAVRTQEDLFAHHLRGNSWEGFVIQQIRAWMGRRAELYFYRTQDGSELDLVITQGSKPVAAIEIKTSNSPVLSKGNLFAFEAVDAPTRLILTPSAADHPYGNNIQVCSLSSIWEHLNVALK